VVPILNVEKLIIKRCVLVCQITLEVLPVVDLNVLLALNAVTTKLVQIKSVLILAQERVVRTPDVELIITVPYVIALTDTLVIPSQDAIHNHVRCNVNPPTFS
jgi:hypothetical protein